MRRLAESGGRMVFPKDKPESFRDAPVREYGMAYFFDEGDAFVVVMPREDLLDEVQWGMLQGGVDAFFGILEDNDFISDESQVKPLLDLWMILCNGIPVWPNNGWAPNELLARTSKRRVFYNEDGSVMKGGGRNDPCPCGSGKKYKRCCGR